jgi:methylenetetrahydrofolate reductase (NADPH)
MHFKNKLERKEFVVLAEVTPPKGADATSMLAGAAQLTQLVDALVVTDMTGAVMRMSALGAAALLQNKGYRTVLEVQCRDRNRLALQGDLLAAGALGITDLLVSAGEDLRSGDHPEANAVFDLQPLDLLEVLAKLQQGRDMAGGELHGAPGFLVGASARVALQGKALETEVQDLRRKSERGAAYFLTQPVFDLASLQPFLKKIEGGGLKLIPTVLLLKSVGMARYIATHIEHIHIPSGLIDRIQNAEDTPGECIRIARELVASLKSEGFSGVCLSALGWEHRAAEVLGSLAYSGARE